MICTFFGHRDVPDSTQEILEDIITYLIKEKNVNTFYIGNNGHFDYLVKKILIFLKTKYPNIKYYVVLAYIPVKNNMTDPEYYSNTIYPEGLEDIPPKFAINRRNLWMIEKSDYVITYVTRTYGGAAKFKELSEKKGKIVINIATAQYITFKE